VTNEPTPPDDRMPLVRTNFVISGSFDPDEVTRLMGLEPSSVLRKGSRIRTSTKSIPVEDSWWLRTTDECYTFEGTDEVAKAVERLKPLAESIDKVRARFPEARIDLTLVAYVPEHPQSAVPNLSLGPVLLRELADLGIIFEIDYMLLGPEPHQT
jgi:hypothetical protein